MADPRKDKEKEMTDRISTDELRKLMADATPGPWVVPDQTYSRSLTVETNGGLDSIMIECPGSGGAMSYTDTVCTLEWTNTPEWDANARLIAAAPDLAAEVIRLREALGKIADHHTGSVKDKETARAALNRKETDNGTA